VYSLSGMTSSPPMKSFWTRVPFGFFAGWLFQKMDHKKPLVSTVIAGLWMAIGYAIGDTILFNFGAAIASLPLNIAQGLVGAFLSTLLYRWLSPYITKKFK